MEQKLIKVGNQVVTNKGRYGRVISIDPNEGNPRCLVRISSKDYWIYQNQLILPEHCIHLKVTYQVKVGEKFEKDFKEVVIKRDSVLYNNNTNYLVQICQRIIETQLNCPVEVLQIKVS